MAEKKERMRLLDSKPRKNFFIQAGFTTGFTYLTSGVFLTGLAILMGATDTLVNYLSVIINICGLLILGFSSFLGRFQGHKKMALILTALSKCATVFIALIPFLFPFRIQLGIFIPTVVLAFTLQAQTTVVINQWMLPFIDEKRSGRYISLRQTLTLLITVILSITSGYWMDSMPNKQVGFLLLFTAAGLLGLCELIFLSRIPDSPIVHSTEQRCRIRDSILIPLKNKSFRTFVLYIMLFYLLLYIADSFTVVYMIKYLSLSYQTITSLYLIISVPQIALLGIWGKISDKKGYQFVLSLSIWLFAGETLFMAFASPTSWFFFIPLAFLIASVANAGFVVAVFNRRYELMPQKNRIAYDNFYTAVIGLGFILGPMLGSLIKNAVEATMPTASSTSPNGIRFLYILSTVGILLLQLVFSFMKRKKAISISENGSLE